MSAPSAVRSGARFGLAGPSDDAGLRSLLRAMPMGASVRVSFEREPSYFAAARVQGDAQVPVVRGADGKVLGMGLRAFAPGFLNGDAVETAYLGDLRLAPEHRGGTLLARGYRYLRELHRDGRASVYATMVVADNAPALTALCSGRAGLPVYRDLGLYRSPAVVLGGRPALPAIPGVSVERGSLERLPDIVAALNSFNRQRDFAPRHTCADFLPGGRWQGLLAGDFYLAMRAGRIVGTLARWDQRAFRQTRVHGYAPALEAARLALRPLSSFLGGSRSGLLSRLPAPGNSVPHFYAAFPSAPDAGILRLLVDTLRRDAAEGEHLYFILGLHSTDPLAKALAGLPQIPFAGRLFAVHWEDGAARAERLLGRLPYLEAGAL